MRIGRAAAAHGFTFVWMLAAIALISAGLAVAGPLWSEHVRRDKEHELLHVGRLYAEAIGSYYRHSPGAAKEYPRSLEHLLRDSRVVGTSRHLRALYPDPIEPARPWGLVLSEDGRIIGIYSQGSGRPLTQRRLELGSVTLEAALAYSDWKFVPREMP